MKFNLKKFFTLRFNSKKNAKTINVFSKVLGTCICLGAGAGIGLTVWQIVKNIELSTEFSKSENIRIEIDCDNLISGADDKTVSELAQTEADNYSQYLISKGVLNYKVYPEWYKTTIDHNDDKDQGYRIFLNASIPVTKVVAYNNIDKDNPTKVDTPYTIAYQNYSTLSNASFLFNPNASYDTTGNIISSVTEFNQQDIVPSTSAKKYVTINHSDDKKINISVKDAESKMDNPIDFNRIGEVFEKANSTPSSSVVTDGEDTEKNPELYIFKDKNALINRMNYILQLYWNNAFQNKDGYSDISNVNFKDYKYLSSNEIKWAQDVTGLTDAGDKINMPQGMTHIPGIYNYSNQQLDSDNSFGMKMDTKHYTLNGLVDSDGNVQDPTTSLNNTIYDNFFYFIDGNWPKSTSSPKFSGTIAYDWMKPYISSIITKTNYTDFFLTKNPNDSSKTSKTFDWFQIACDSTNDAKIMHSMYVKNYNTLPIKIIPNSTNDSDIANGGNVECLKTTANNIFLTQHDFDKNIFSSNPLYSMIIAFGVILLCVGIIISVLYRIPGLLSFIFLLLSFTTTLFILIYAGYTLSFGVIMGLFIGFCIAFISYFSIFSYIKKHFNSSHNYMLSIKKAIKEKIFKIFDINIIIFLLGICFTYFGTSELSPFGMSVIISVSIFIGVGLILWLFTNYLFFYKYKEKSSNKLLFQNIKTKTKILDSFGKISTLGSKKDLIVPCVLAIITILGVVLLFTIGVHGSYAFYDGTIIRVDIAKYNVLKDSINNITKWRITNDDNYYYFATSKIVSYDKFTAIQGLGTDYFIQNVSTAGAKFFLLKTIYSSLIAIALCCVYVMVRANIFSVIPFFFGSILAPFITVMAMFAFQIPFTENISLMIVLIFAISTVLTYLTITNIITKELKFNIFNRKQLIDNIKLNSLANFKTTLPLIILLLVISILMIVTSSTSVIFIFAGMAIFLVFSVVISYYIMPMLLMLFISIRYKYLNVVYKISIFGNTKYDKINEESIDSINSFSRRKIVNHIEEK